MIHQEKSDPPSLADFFQSESVVLEDWEIEIEGSDWIPVKCDTPLANGGTNVCEGFARLRAAFEYPQALDQRKIQLVCEAVGDGFKIGIDGNTIGEAGNLTGTWDGTRDKPVAFPINLDSGLHEIEILAKDWRGGGVGVGPILLTATPESLLY